MSDTRAAYDLFSQLSDSGLLPEVGPDEADGIATVACGGDPEVFGSMMGEFYSQDALASRDAISEFYRGLDDQMHDDVRTVMQKRLGLSDQQMDRLYQAEQAGDPSSLLAAKEAFVFN